MRFFEYVSALLWGPLGSSVILCGALYLLFKLKAFYILHPIKTLKAASRGGGISAMLTALGGSIGVGNIVGVGVALSAGGAGAVFWMWVCALITAVLKYAEIYLAVRHRLKSGGGPMRYLRALGTPYLAQIFCVLCIVSSFGIGCSVQSNAVGMSASHLGFSKASVGLLLTFFCFITFMGGGKRLQKVCNILVPIMSVLYILGCTVIISLNITRLSEVMKCIVTSAFSFKSAFGGIGASLFMRGLREGMSKGIFSAESGMGSSSIAYALSESDSPEKQGVWGVLEVFLDTVVMCSLSALVLLLSDTESVFSAFGAYFGDIGVYFTLIALFCFAYTSICCWSFYGTSCMRSMTNRKWAPYIYNALFSICIFVGAVSDTGSVWAISDLCNALMLFVNFFGMLKLSSHLRSPI